MSEESVAGEADTTPVDSLPTEAEECEVPVEMDTPGSVLRRNREAQGRTIADVVQVIRFSARQIEALERDDYKSLPGSIAVRGMVRNYAKYLRLDSTPLLKQLEPAVPVSEADVRPPANMGEAEPPNIVERVPPKFVAVGVLVLLLVLGSYWYVNFQGSGGGLAYLVGRVGHTSDPATPELAANQANPGADSGVVMPITPASVAVEHSPIVSSTDSIPTPFAGLHVEFDDLSWIEVRDATQKVIYVGEYPAGTRQDIEGKPPLQIWIGKASGVRVFMGGRSIDLKPYTREEVARFSLE